mgnify:FL=1
MSKKQSSRKQTTNTIDTIHQKKMHKFNKESKKLTKMKKRIKEITFLLDEFNEESDSQPVVKVKKSRRGRKKKEDKDKNPVKMVSTSTIKSYDEYYVLLEEKNDLIKRVEKVNNQEDIADYYLENGELIFQYYDQKRNPNFMKKKRTSQNAKKTMKKDSIIYYLMKNRRKSPEEAKTEEKEVVEEDTASIAKPDDGIYKGMLKYIGKNDIIDKYMRRMDPNYQIPLEYDDHIDYCDNCKCSMMVVHSEGIVRCEKCGMQEDILIDSDKPSFKDPPREMSYFSYKKLNHLAEYLGRKSIIVRPFKYILSCLKSLYQ